MECSQAQIEDGSGHRRLGVPRRLVRGRAAAARLWVRTTVRDLAREPEVRAGSRPRSTPATASGARRRPAPRRRLGARRSRAATTSSTSPPPSRGAAEGPRRADRARARGHPAGPAARASTPASSGSSSPPRSPRSPAAASAGRGRSTEEDWSDPDNPKLTPYARSKTIAERAAWDLVRERGAAEKLAVVNPGAILGPVLSDDRSYSLEAIERLLRGCRARRGSASASSTSATSPTCRSGR